MNNFNNLAIFSQQPTEVSAILYALLYQSFLSFPSSFIIHYVSLQKPLYNNYQLKTREIFKQKKRKTARQN